MISLFEYATPSVKLRSTITRSSRPVAAIWQTAPTSTQPANGAVGVGSGVPPNPRTTPSHSTAKGSP